MINLKKKLIKYSSSLIDLEMDVTTKMSSSKFTTELQRAYSKLQLENNIEEKLPDIRMNDTLFEYNHETEMCRLIWGAVTVVCHFLGLILSALPLAEQQYHSILDRLRLNGMTQNEVQLVHWLTRFTLIIIQNILIILCILSLVKEAFTLRNLLYGLLFGIVQTLCGFSFGIFLFMIFQQAVPILICGVTIEMCAATISGKKNKMDFLNIDIIY